jgi:hypothetical protein
MYMEYAAEILRGWPADGALDRVELVKQGTTLVNGDIVEMQSDGTVALSSATPSNRVGLVIRGNGDSGSAANANGRFMTPQPSKPVTAVAWSAGVLSVTIGSGHGYVKGNSVTVSGVATATTINGTYTITEITSSTVFKVVLVADPTASGAVLTTAVCVQNSTYNNSGEAVVLWSNYIVKTTNYAAGAYVPGSAVTATSGKFALATATSQSGLTPFAVTFGDPVVGHVLRVQAGVTSNSSGAAQTAHLVIAVL